MIGAEGMTISKIAGYGFGGELMPLLDVETAVDLNVIWDRMIPKARTVSLTAGALGIDTDWDDVAGTPFIEPGEVDVNNLLGLMEPNKSIFDPRMSYSSWATNKGGWVAGSPDVFNPSDFKTFRSRRTLKADVSSYGLLAVASPTFDSEATTESSFSFARFGLLESLREHIQLATLMQLGLAETGAETPMDVMSSVIEDLVAPQVVQPAAAVIITQQWTFFCRATWLCDSGSSAIPSKLSAY